MARPLIGITCDVVEDRAQIRGGYSRAVWAAGGVPLLLAPGSPGEDAATYAAMCDGFVLSGGDDPAMEPFDDATHPRATLISPARQQFETDLLRTLEANLPGKPVLGVCLGMQMMGLVAGAGLNQHMPDDVPSHADHEGGAEHLVRRTAGSTLPDEGMVVSRHRQALRDAGSMRIIGVAHDGVVEAIDDPSRPFYVGVQWHPERTSNASMGQRLFDLLLQSCG
ncbi:MAG: gamma-glutamyl-gamma-aminobutyrate hydrolase family protein [Planctomycetota bacterium]